MFVEPGFILDGTGVVIAVAPIGQDDVETISLFSGGLLPRVLRRIGVRGVTFDRVRAVSIAAVPLVAWLPLFALSALSGTLLSRSLGTPFLLDLGAHIRFLVVLPLLLLAGHIAERRIRPTIEQFKTHYLVPDDMVGRFDAAVASAYRLGDSVVADLVTIALIFAAASPLIWQVYVGLNGSTWYATSQVSALTAAGRWYVYVSLPIFQFVLLRWYYRLFIWARFLAHVSRLNLQLIPTHPDRVGGLGFLLLSMQSLSIFAMAHGALLAAWLANRVLVRGMPLQEFKGEIAVVVAFVLIITIAPLFAFMRPLVLAKRRGVLEYGTLASHYVYDFDRKWLRGKELPNEPLVGSADVQSLADMGGSYELVRDMRILPVSLQMIAAFVIATLLPVAPFLLTVMPLNELIHKLVNILF